VNNVFRSAVIELRANRIRSRILTIPPGHSAPAETETWRQTGPSVNQNGYLAKFVYFWRTTNAINQWINQLFVELDSQSDRRVLRQKYVRLANTLRSQARFNAPFIRHGSSFSIYLFWNCLHTFQHPLYHLSHNLIWTPQPFPLLLGPHRASYKFAVFNLLWI